MISALTLQREGRLSADPILSLKQSLADLVLNLEHSGKLRTDIETAVRSRRYEQYKRSMISGVHAVERRLAAAQGMHLMSLLRFVDEVAAAGANDMAGRNVQPSNVDPLEANIRELKANLRRARRLSLDVRVAAECRNWAAVGFQSAGGSPHIPKELLR